MYEWDSKNVILTGSKDGVVRVCRNYFTMNYRKLIFFKYMELYVHVGTIIP